MKRIVIALEGFSGTGKSSTAKQVAEKLSYQYIDSGAMYRAVTHLFIEKKVDLTDTKSIEACLDDCEITFDREGVVLNGHGVEGKIRTMEVNKKVSAVSAISMVRRVLVEQQQKIGEGKGVVMDGRDIGTVVFPQADLKVFMTADADIRARRRMLELQSKGIEEDIEVIKHNLLQRDQADSTREDSPLKMAEDAVEIDTSNLTMEDQVKRIVDLAKERIHEG